MKPWRQSMAADAGTSCATRYIPQWHHCLCIYMFRGTHSHTCTWYRREVQEKWEQEWARPPAQLYIGTCIPPADSQRSSNHINSTLDSKSTIVACTHASFMHASNFEFVIIHSFTVARSVWSGWRGAERAACGAQVAACKSRYGT